MLNPLASQASVNVRRTFSTTPDKAFHAWTDPAALRAWWRPGPYVVTQVQIDLRVGGHYEVTMSSAVGSVQRLTGTYLEIAPPRRLVMTWTLHGSPLDDGYEALLLLDFNEVPEGTQLVLRHERLNPATKVQFEAGWHGLTTRLDKFLSLQEGPP